MRATDRSFGEDVTVLQRATVRRMTETTRPPIQGEKSTNSGRCLADTWHDTVKSAMAQALNEFGADEGSDLGADR